MKEIIINDKAYHIIENVKDAVDINEMEQKITEYFYPFDYIVGDWAYGKLRLKGFYQENHPECQKMNNINYVDDYIKKFCAYGCRHFIIAKIKE